MSFFSTASRGMQRPYPRETKRPNNHGWDKAHPLSIGIDPYPWLAKMRSKMYRPIECPTGAKVNQ